MRRVVTLFGNILRSNVPSTFVFDVAPELGDAKEFGLAGQIALARRQCLEIIETPDLHGKDIVRIPEHIAALKAEASGPREKKRRGK